MQPKDRIQVVFVPGLAANAGIFENQLQHFSGSAAIDWLQPLPNETMDRYAERLAEPLKDSKPLILVGASFGGIIALAMAKHLQPAAIVLIGSVRSPGQLPMWVRLSRRLVGAVRFLPVRLMQILLRPTQWRVFRSVFPFWSELAGQFVTADPNVFRWSLRQILLWRDEPVVECQVHRIHGRWDFVLPAEEKDVEQMIDGGHVLSITCPKEVNSFIRKVIESCTV